MLRNISEISFSIEILYISPYQFDAPLSSINAFFFVTPFGNSKNLKIHFTHAPFNLAKQMHCDARVACYSAAMVASGDRLL